MCIRSVKINIIAKGAVEMAGEKNDFSKGSIVGNIVNLAIPMTLAQLINVLYNIVDRIYIGRIMRRFR